jgi:hypothetical protein
MSATRSTPSVDVVCDSCGTRFELATRNAREHHRTGKPPRCALCRGIGPLPPATEEDRRFWLDALGLQEARQLGGMIWTDDVVDV